MPKLTTAADLFAEAERAEALVDLLPLGDPARRVLQADIDYYLAAAADAELKAAA